MLRILLTMKYILTLFLFISINLQSQSLHEIGLFDHAPVLRNGGDKILHFTCSYVIAYNTYKYFEHRVPKKRARLYSVLVPLVVGAAKEFIDEKYRKGWEKEDMYANIGGIILFRYDLTK